MLPSSSGCVSALILSSSSTSKSTIREMGTARKTGSKALTTGLPHEGSTRPILAAGACARVYNSSE
eukprot:1642077-Prymnesium_polylepis.1